MLILKYIRVQTANPGNVFQHKLASTNASYYTATHTHTDWSLKSESQHKEDTKMAIMLLILQQTNILSQEIYQLEPFLSRKEAKPDHCTEKQRAKVQIS